MLKELKPIDPKSQQSFIDLLRMHLDVAFDERMVYLEISYKTEKMDRINSISIASI